MDYITKLFNLEIVEAGIKTHEETKIVDERTTMNQTLKATTIKTGKYLTFSLENEEYGISILKIKEIIGMMPITSVPKTPAFVKGIINLRGKVIPVVDLRLKFNMESIPYSERTCIIVVEMEAGACTVFIGIVVDAVSEVLNIKEEEIEETPTFGIRMDTAYILGMAKTRGGVTILLDIDKVLSTEEISVLEKTI